MNKWLKTILIAFMVLAWLALPMRQTFAVKDFNVKNNTQSLFLVNGTTGNVGVGTTTPQGGFVVTNGNVGIGTWTAAGGNLIVNGGGNVGIGSVWPGTALDVNGIIRSTTGGVKFPDGTTQITAATSTPPAGSGTEIQYRNGASFGAAANSAINASGNVGLGTTLSVNKLDVQGGVGIGTAYAGYFAAPSNGLIVQGNVGVGTATPQGAFVVTNGNVGIGTWAPVQPLHVNGHCVTGDTRLRRRRRRKAKDTTGNWIEEDYFEEVEIMHIRPGDEILTLDEKSGRMVASKVKALMDMGVKDIFVLKTATGKVIRTTGEHPYLIAPVLAQPRVAVFIDAANFEVSLRSLDLTADYGLVDKALGGKIVSKNYYSVNFNDESQGKLFTYLKHHGYRLVTKALKQIRRRGDSVNKANFDVEIAFDSAHFKDDYDVLVLFSGDSDFVYMVEKLQKMGKHVIVVSPSSRTAKELKAAASMFVELKEMAFLKDNKKGPLGANKDDLTTAVEFISRFYPFVNGGEWKKVVDLKVGQMIATVGDNGKPIFERIVSIENKSAEQVWDIEVEGTHNFVGNDIIAHNTYISGNLGIGTTTPQTSLVSMGNVGIGTWTAVGGNLIVNGGGNVGIGTPWPGTILDVQGTGRMTGFQLTTSPTTAGFVLQTNSVGVGTWVNPSTILSAGGSAAGNANAVQYNSGSSTFAGNDSKFFFDGTNVGIGTTMTEATPSGLLSVKGNVGIGTVTPQGALVVTNGNVGIGTWAPLGILNVNTNAGNVGIGTATTAPSSPLVVSRAAIGSSLSYTNVYSAPTNGLMVQGNVGIGTTSPGAQLSVSVNTSGLQTPTAGTVLHVTGADNAKARIEVDSFGTQFSTLNLRAALGTGAAPSAMTIGHAIGLINAIGYGATAYGAFSTMGYSASEDWTDTANGTLFTLATIPNGTTVGVERMRIDNTGYIGIGTTTPQTQLAVAGNVGIGTWTAAGGKLIVNGGGNVGIGSAWPGTIVDVQGTTRTTGFQLNLAPLSGGNVLVSNSVGVGTWMPASTLATSGGTPGGSSSQLQYNNGGSFAGIANSNVTASGNVGLGTTLSTNKLDVQGGVGIGTAYAGYFAAPLNGLIVQGNVGVGTNSPQTGFVSMGNVGIGTWTAAGGNLIVNGGGNVGIGTPWPGATLDVAGTFRVTNSGALATYFMTNVGINSSAPGSELDISGTARMSGFALTTTPSGGYVLVSGSTGIGTWMPASTLSTASTSPGGSSGQIQYNSSSAFAGIVNSSVNASGNVGLGTTLSTNKLDVQGGVGIGTAYAGYSSAPSSGLIVSGNVGIGTATPGGTFELKGSYIARPSTTTSYDGATAITVTNVVMRINTTGGVLPVGTNPQITAGIDGQMVTFIGTSDANAVQFVDGTGLKLAGAVSFALGNKDSIMFMYDATNSVWTEITRSNN